MSSLIFFPHTLILEENLDFVKYLALNLKKMRKIDSKTLTFRIFMEIAIFSENPQIPIDKL